MIWSSARVTLADGKTMCPIEDLQIGQSLFNPLTGEPQEVTDILKRSPAGPDGTCPPALMPHLIRAESFGPGLPQLDIWLSPAQFILAASPRGRPDRLPPYPALAPVAARKAGTPDLPEQGRYVAIFLDRQGPILVEALTLTAYNLSCLDRGHSPSHRRIYA